MPAPRFTKATQRLVSGESRQPCFLMDIHASEVSVLLQNKHL